MSHSFIYLVSITLLLPSVFAVQPLSYSCFSSDTFTPNGPYAHNLKKLIATTLQSPPFGYANGSWGRTQNEVFGLSLCRGDVTFNGCKSCLAMASSAILKRCPRIKAAIIWYDQCSIKYHYLNFFGDVDFTNTFIAANTGTVSDPVTFNNQTTRLLDALAKEASGNDKLYAAGEMDVENLPGKLYGMVQCTRDLIGFDCYRCLDSIIAYDVVRYCDGKRGCRIVNGSCGIRYELYPFVKA